ncbi:MAG: 2-phospho-L-lactate transferase CofD family protein [Solirubrobacterales bacterium]
MANAELNCALLAGGTGGAKLAVGLRDILHGFDDEPAEQPGQLNVIANTGDDIEIYDVHVSPDPDLISFRLADALDERGFGVRGEAHQAMDLRRDAGEAVWFELGDDDLAVCAQRAAALADGKSLTEAHRMAIAAYPSGGAVVLPMCDEPVRTVVETTIGPRGIQQFLIQDQSKPEIVRVEFEGAEHARATNSVVDAIDMADLIIIGPSNPIISIGPILAVPGIREAIVESRAPVLAVSPFVDGAVLKGPTEKFLVAAGHEPNVAGVAAYYGDLVDAWVADEPVIGRPHHLASVAMPDPLSTRAVAAEILRYGASL